MKLHVVVNPAGASGRTGKRFKKLIPILDSCGHDVDIHYSTREHGIGAICSEITSAPAEEELYIILMGGDGTLNEAINGMNHPQRIHLGYLPAGSGNDLAKSLGLSGKDLDRQLSNILELKDRRTMDIGEITYGATTEALYGQQAIGYTGEDGLIRRRFHDSTGLGFDAAICQAADASKYKTLLNKLHMGKLIYIFNAIKLIFSMTPANISVECDGTVTKYKDTMLFVCMNNNYEGGGFKFCPEAKNNDGLLDTCIATPAKKMDFFKIFPTAYDGSHLKFDSIHMGRGKSIHVTSDTFEWVHTDGEVKCRSNEVSIRLLPEQIKLLM